MSDTSGQPTGTPPPTDPKTEEPTPALTQEQANAIGTRQKEEGRRAEAQRVAAELGMTVDEAKALIKANRDREDAEKSELEKAKSEFDTLKSESEKTQSQIKSEHHADRLKLRLLRANVPLPDDEAKADEALVNLAGFINPRVEVGASVEKIDEAIAEVKGLFPQLFSAPSVPGTLRVRVS